jgi:tetratricopeptide (TPR) repeat protein
VTADQVPQILKAAASALREGQVARAEALLRTHLRRVPADVVAIGMLAEVASRLGRHADAAALLERCLELAPDFNAARHQYAVALHRQNEPKAALRQVEQLVQLEPHNPSYRQLQAGMLLKIGEYRESIKIYAEVLADHPEHPKIWLSYGHALSAVGRQQDSAAAYRKSIQLSPNLSEAYWSLANLKTVRFDAVEQNAMRAQLVRGDLSDEDRVHLDFAMGKALEDDADYAQSFAHYARANRLQNSRDNYDADKMSDFVRHSKDCFSTEFFKARQGFGSPAADPIFIVGLPRAGSTLIEQILAGHSSVEGTMELPDLVLMAGTLAAKSTSGVPPYPAMLAGLTTEACRQLGQQYLDQTRVQRKTTKPLFIDKTPHNFLHIGLIRLVLPNAKIIDARRHPMACGFSAFKQHFAEGHRFTFSFENIGRYYRDYVELMDHFERVIPGTVHRILYENLIDDSEAEVERLLSYCGLAFESDCLRFHENDRPVQTPSALQVRQPLYRDGIDHWRRYEHWLQPLKDALGDVLDTYPAQAIRITGV